MIYVLKMNFMNSQDTQWFIPCQVFHIFSFLNGCCFWFSHLGKIVQDLQIYLSFGEGVSQSLKSIQKYLKSSKYVIHKFSFSRGEAIMVPCQSGNFFQLNIFCSFIVDAQQVLDLFGYLQSTNLVVLISGQSTCQSIMRFLNRKGQ